MSKIENLKQAILDAGAQRAAVVRQEDVIYEASFRDMCRQNSCGVYGKCHMCPPDVGPIDELIAAAKRYSAGVMYQNVYPLEDSFDIEGMQEAKKLHNACAQRIHPLAKGELHLAAGGCGVCARCSKLDDEPCRFPERAIPSLEAYGVDVYRTSKNAGLAYVNGPNTVTYFGMVLIQEDENA